MAIDPVGVGIVTTIVATGFACYYRACLTKVREDRDSIFSRNKELLNREDDFRDRNNRLINEKREWKARAMSLLEERTSEWTKIN